MMFAETVCVTYREGPKRPILNKAMRTCFIFMKAHRLGLCTETLLLIYGATDAHRSFNSISRDVQRATAISVYRRKSSPPLFRDKSYIFVTSPISSCVSITIHNCETINKVRCIILESDWKILPRCRNKGLFYINFISTLHLFAQQKVHIVMHKVVYAYRYIIQ